METIAFAIIFFLQISTTGCVIYGIYLYIKARRIIRILSFKMDCDELLDQLIQETPSEVQSPNDDDNIAKKRARLAALAAGGQLKTIIFKGAPLNAERVDQMKNDEILEAHARYEARLGTAMSKSLGSSLLRLYVSAAAMLLPLPAERQPTLVADLEEDPFVSAALSSACCELYYRYGMYLAPLTAAITTAKHCDWSIKDTSREEYNTAQDGLPSGDDTTRAAESHTEEP